MNNQFGKSLRRQMEKTGIKESKLADVLSYDATYISKWLNGSKLPSPRNAERIIQQMADFFMDYTPCVGDEERKTQRQIIFTELNMAYASDSNYHVFHAYSNKQMSFVDNQQTLVQLTREALSQALKMDDGNITITATFDLFQLYGKEFKNLMQELQAGGVKRVALKLAINPEDLTQNYYFYAANILNTIGGLKYIEMSITSKKLDQPDMVVINDLLCLQILWNFGGELAAVFSMENKIVQHFSYMCQQIIETAEKLLDPAEPERLKRTNVQLDSYSDHRQWLFFNEPPALLFPEEIMDGFIEHAEDEHYANYLLKLKNVFTKHTCKSKIDLVIYSSMLNKYLSDGEISLGNVRQRLEQKQTYDHIRHLSQIMTENPEFELYLIRDTVVYSEELRKSPSIFLDTYSLNIEKSQNNPNDNYHISMDPRMQDAFRRFFEKMLSQSYCTRLTAEDLLRYL